MLMDAHQCMTGLADLHSPTQYSLTPKGNMCACNRAGVCRPRTMKMGTLRGSGSPNLPMCTPSAMRSLRAVLARDCGKKDSSWLLPKWNT